jgi:LysM repeat protein
VQPGDTLSAIATRYDVTVDNLVRVNRIVDPDTLQVGHGLTIPTPSAPQ